MSFTNSPSISTSTCRHCRHYVPEGRRGGSCQQLNVSVRSGWKACSLALPPFAPSWESFEIERLWKEELLSLQESVFLSYMQPEVYETDAHRSAPSYRAE
ncbi:hypothetical protein BST81_17090 [Leptolyngbya sp. 'hensonii']|nr:hypothetical protein BST81_17090 [Leptolyngbya sp. 'hensonii']